VPVGIDHIGAHVDIECAFSTLLLEEENNAHNS